MKKSLRAKRVEYGGKSQLKEVAVFHWQNQPLKVKGKAITSPAWTGPEVFRRFRFPDFKTISI
jgi:hypothetical protein